MRKPTMIIWPRGLGGEGGRENRETKNKRGEKITNDGAYLRPVSLFPLLLVNTSFGMAQILPSVVPSKGG